MKAWTQVQLHTPKKAVFLGRQTLPKSENGMALVTELTRCGRERYE